jgi:hypothetical protein
MSDEERVGMATRSAARSAAIVLVLAVIALAQAACVTEPVVVREQVAPWRGPAWVPGHFNWRGYWVPGHWR